MHCSWTHQAGHVSIFGPPWLLLIFRFPLVLAGISCEKPCHPPGRGGPLPATEGGRGKISYGDTHTHIIYIYILKNISYIKHILYVPNTTHLIDTLYNLLHTSTYLIYYPLHAYMPIQPIHLHYLQPYVILNTIYYTSNIC